MRFSSALIPTLRDEPADAEVASHKLMVRAGMVRKVAAGIYTYLPLAWRSIRKVEQIVREEMETGGAQELRMPAIQPSGLWKETGRWGKYGKELLRLKDRNNREFCIGPTHEEIITDLIRGEVRSYKALPLNLYQMQTKFRDEIRPRFGLMRSREFIMKDGYSFDADAAGAEKTYATMSAAYHRIFTRLGLNFRAVEADSGQIGGNFSHEFMVLADTGEDAVVYCGSCDYGANSEKATSKVSTPEKRDTPAMESVDTPGINSVTDVAKAMETTPDRLIKTLIFNSDPQPEPGKTGARLEVGNPPKNFVAVLIRGDREVNEIKLANYLGVPEIWLVPGRDIERLTGGPEGFSGPVDLNLRVIADASIADLTDAVCGANTVDTHLAHVLPGRDFNISDSTDLDTAQAGDGCPRCDGTLGIRRGIEVGHIFMLGTQYSEDMGATFLDQNQKKQPFVMGCYGIGIGRAVAAAVEQNHDDRGIVWPMAIAPYQVDLVAMNMKSEALSGAAEMLYGQLQSAGVEVLFDDRKDRGGVKLNDAELIGIPLTIVLGDRGLAKGICELKNRASGDTREIALDAICGEVQAFIRDALND